MMVAGYKPEPISTKMEELIQARLTYLRAELRIAKGEVDKMGEQPQLWLPHLEAIVKKSRLEGNIGSLEWVLREAETIKQSPLI